MSPAFRAFLREWTPPRMLAAYRRLRGESIRFSGEFANWEEARLASKGYDDALIVERVRQATLKANASTCLMERDGMVLPSDVTFPLLASLQHVALSLGRLRVLDFGGALGGLYFHLRRHLPPNVPVLWTVVEQRRFVECGKLHFAVAELSFEENLERALSEGVADVALLSSVLPYLEHPHQTLSMFLNSGCEYLLLDRTPVLREATSDRLTVQTVDFLEYSASYPAWFFVEAPLLEEIGVRYKSVFGFDSFESWDLGALKSQSIGGLFRKNGT